MFGGVTNASELRIADVVDKYAIPTVKVTGGQRIDLLGVKKENLQNVSARSRYAERSCLWQGAAHRKDVSEANGAASRRTRRHGNRA